MANTAFDFYKKQMSTLKYSELWKIILESPVGVHATAVSKDKVKVAIEILDERQNSLFSRIETLEKTLKITNKAKPGPKVKATV